ncbi:MAG: flavodoxin family protein [Bryobacteraceae bacterium]
MKVLAINGSPRESGNTAFLLKRICGELEEEGIRTETMQVGGADIQGCNACYKCSTERNRRCSVDEDEANDFITKMFEADGIILASPTYFTDVSAEMKALIDRAGLVARGNGNLLRRKVGAAVVTMRRAGAIHAFDTLNHFFLINEMIVPGSSYWNICVARDPGEAEHDQEGLRTMDTLARNMAWLLKKLGGKK